MGTMVEKLKEYFNTTSKEQQDKDWEAVKHWDNVGPTVEEYVKAYGHEINKETKE